MKKTGIKLARENKGLTILELSKLLKVNVSVIKGWEEGAGTISLNIVYDLIKILDTTSEMILFGIQNKPLNIDFLLEEQKKFILIFYNFIKDNYIENFKIDIKPNNRINSPRKNASISEKIKYLRESILDMNQSQFAKMINVTRGSINNWENGLSRPTISHITMICCLCHVTTDYLIMDNHPLEISPRELSNDEYLILKEFIQFLKRKNEKLL